MRRYFFNIISSGLLLTALYPSQYLLAEEINPLSLLQRMQQSNQAVNYEGRYVYFNGQRLDTLQIYRSVDGDLERERIQHLSGKPAEVIKSGDKLDCYHPNDKVTQLSLTNNKQEFVAPGSDRRFGNLDVLSEHYQLNYVGIDRVADRSAHQVRMIPRDQVRYGHSLWLDDDSGLLLKLVTADNKGRMLEMFEFVSLSLRETIPVEKFQPNPQLTRVLLKESAGSGVDPLSLIRGKEDTAEVPSNWSIAWMPSGFQRSNLSLQASGANAAGTRIYTDGISAFSLFFAPIAEVNAVPPATRQGATMAVSRIVEKPQASTKSRYMLTVVGEIPLSTGQQVIESFRWTD